MEDDGPTLLILIHQRRVLEVLNQRIPPLNTSESDFAHFVAVELLPRAVMVAVVEIYHRDGI
jgi:hypothetical protein